jgi:hypothetical protein
LIFELLMENVVPERVHYGSCGVKSSIRLGPSS